MSPRCPQSPLQRQISLLDGEFVLTCSVSDLFYTIVLLACGLTQPVNQFNKQSLFSMSAASTFTIRSIVYNLYEFFHKRAYFKTTKSDFVFYGLSPKKTCKHSTKQLSYKFWRNFSMKQFISKNVYTNLAMVHFLDQKIEIL